MSFVVELPHAIHIYYHEQTDKLDSELKGANYNVCTIESKKYLPILSLSRLFFKQVFHFIYKYNDALSKIQCQKIDFLY